MGGIATVDPEPLVLGKVQPAMRTINRHRQAKRRLKRRIIPLKTLRMAKFMKQNYEVGVSTGVSVGITGVSVGVVSIKVFVGTYVSVGPSGMVGIGVSGAHGGA